MRKLTTTLILVTLVGFIGLGAHNLIKNYRAGEALKREYEKAQQEHQRTEEQLETEQKNREELQKKEQEQQQKIDELNKQLQAKRENAAKLANALTLTETAHAEAAPAPSGGSCNEWKAAAGIPNTHATNTLINNESGCNPSVYNKAGSGACGIPQALPCSKLPCSLDAAGAVCQLKWMDNYVKQRYNTWEGALAFWHCKGRCTNNYGTINKTTNWY